MMYVEFMKNFHVADSSELMAVRLILPSDGGTQQFDTGMSQGSGAYTRAMKKNLPSDGGFFDVLGPHVS